MGTDAFLATFKAEVFGGGGLDGYAVNRYVQYVGNTLAHLWYEGPHFGLLCHNDAVDIADAIAFLSEKVVAVMQQQLAVDAFVSRVGVGKMLANVSECGGTKQGVTDGVEQNVGVGMSQQPFAMGYLNTPQPKFAVVNKLMYVVS